MMNLFYNIGEI